MSKDEFIEKLRNSPIPVVVDFWAPWCGPCRVIEPSLEKLRSEYAGRVDLWKVNADENADLLSALHLYGIPTLIAYHAGQEVGRRTGAASGGQLSLLFDSAISGTSPVQAGPAVADRILRLGGGLALAGLGFLGDAGWLRFLLAGIGSLVMFTAIYDRCPIYQMVSTRMKEIFRQGPASVSNK
jgi:thioredoxin